MSLCWKQQYQDMTRQDICTLYNASSTKALNLISKSLQLKKIPVHTSPLYILLSIQRLWENPSEKIDCSHYSAEPYSEFIIYDGLLF